MFSDGLIASNGVWFQVVGCKRHPTAPHLNGECHEIHFSLVYRQTQDVHVSLENDLPREADR
jgi:hypothetical protein